MNLVNNLSNNSNKASAIPANVLAALNSASSSGQLTDKLFSDILSQNQPPPAPQNNTQAQTKTDANGDVQPDQNTDTSDNQDDTNSTPQPAVQAPVAQNWTVVGKPQHNHAGKTQTDKGKSQTGSNPTDAVSAAAQSNTNTQVNQTTATTTAIVAANNSQDDSQTDNATGNTSNDNTNTKADANDAQTLTADLNATVVQPTVQAPQAPVAPQPATPSATDGTTNAGDNATTPDANSNASDPQLMLLLMQLERLTAAAKVTAPAIDATAATTQDANVGLIAPTNSQGKTDLKSLLAAITKSNVSNFLGSNNLTDPTNNAASNQDAQNAGAAANTPPAAQNTQQPTAPTSAQQTAADKWMNDNFANLFNVVNNNQVNTNTPATVNVAAGIALGNSDGAALDADTQGQNQTGSRDITANTGLNNNLLPATGTAQASNPYDFASELSNLRATKGGATGLPTPVEQVVLQLRNGLSKDGSTQMTIQLRPAELGRIDVKLNVSSDGKVQGTVTADNPTTLNLLLKDVRGLERALQDAGLRADSGSLQFNLRGDGQTGGSFNQTANNSSGFSGDASQDASTSLPVLADAAETYYLTPGGVNMRV